SGDVFLLGTTSCGIRRVENGRVRVEDAHGAAPSIPFWNGEAPGRTPELSAEVSRLRADILAAPQPEWLLHEGGLDRLGAEQAIAYVQSGARALGVLPASAHVVAERFFDEGGGMQFVLHAPFGARINRAWGLALRKRFCRTFNFELQAAATDNGIVLSLGEQHSFPLEIVFEFLRPETVEDVLTQALLDAPMFTARWRWNASRALAILRFAHGSRVPAPIQRMRADDLLAATFPDQAACAENLTGPPRIPDHPLVRETIHNCLHEAMDLDGLIAVLEGIRGGAIRTSAVDTPEATPFSHEILNANPYAFLDDAPLEERRARAVQLRRTVRTDFVDGAGALDPDAIVQVAAEAWPLVRDPDELHEALLTLVTVPPIPEWEPFFAPLVETGRAATLSILSRDREGAVFWTPAERTPIACAVHPDATLTPPIHFRGDRPETEEACAAEILRGWFESGGPYRASELAARLAMPPALVDSALAQLEAEGQILRGRFTPGANFHGADEPEWCHRRLLARIHRLTIGLLRREIEPVTTADFVRFLHRWQHVAPGAQLHGADGVLHVIRQLQGYEISAAAWEAEILPSRVAHYSPEFLDQLCVSGEVMWGRLSPHPAFDSDGNGRAHRVRPTRVAPLTLFLREDAAWLLAGPQPASRAKWKTGSGSWWPRAWLPQTASRTFARSWTPSAAAARDAADWRVPGTPPDVGRCCAALPGRQAKSPPRLSRANCCSAGAWSSAIWRRAKLWRPLGAICWWNCAAWKRAAKSAAAALPEHSWASSSLCPRRSTCCVPCAAQGNPAIFPKPRPQTRCTSPESCCLVRAAPRHRRRAELPGPLKPYQSKMHSGGQMKLAVAQHQVRYLLERRHG